MHQLIDFVKSYSQTYTYDTGDNLTCLSHQENSNIWQQNIDIHSSSNRGTETNHTTDFDINGNLLNLDNIGSLDWHYNNTLSKLTKNDKKTTEYFVYDYQGNRVRTVLESNQKKQNQRDYLFSLDVSTNQKNQAINTLHIGTHILAETTKNTIETRYQLSSHLQSNTLELNDKAEIISYEHFYPYGGTAIIAGKDQTQVQQKRYRYTGKERDDSSGLSYYGARYLAPWMARWISPDSAGEVDGLNLYVYVGNNPLKYIDPTGHILTIPWSKFIAKSNQYKKDVQALNFWVGDVHNSPHSKFLSLDLLDSLDVRNFILESCTAGKYDRHPKNPNIIVNLYTTEWAEKKYPTPSAEHAKTLATAMIGLMLTASRFHAYYLGRGRWKEPIEEYQMMKDEQLLKGNFIALVGVAHLLTYDSNPMFPFISTDSLPLWTHIEAETSIALIPKKFIDLDAHFYDTLRGGKTDVEYGVWVRAEDGLRENAFLAMGKKSLMQSVFGKDVVQAVPQILKGNLTPVTAERKK